MDKSIQKFLLNGNLYIWEYKEKNPNRRCWNFTADNKGCDSLIQLLDLMLRSEYGSNKTLKTSIPTNQQIDLQNNRNTEWETKNYLHFIYLLSDPKKWELKKHEDVLEINFGKEKMIELIEAIKKVKAKQGDFAIGDGNNNHILYFW